MWRRFRDLAGYLAPESSLVSPRKHVAVMAALLAVAAIAGAVVLKPSHQPAPGLWERLRSDISGRAEVEIYDDFSQGLDAWDMSKKQPATWSYDKNGFVNVGAFSVFEPSRRLADYDLDALVEIESKGVGLAFRAASMQSYQVVKIIVDGSGPSRSLAVQRYAVVAGRPSRPVITRSADNFYSDTLYQVHLKVRGDDFALYIQGNLVDS